MLIIKLIVVDHNLENVKIIKNIIKKEFKNIRFIQTISSDKEDIYRIIENNDISLIGIDIDTFGIKTLPIIQMINRKYPNVMFIYYGKLVDKDYIDKLATINCINILYKPLNEIEVNRAFLNAVEYFCVKEKEYIYNTKLEERCLSNTSRFKDKFISNILGNKIRDEDEINRGFQYYRIKVEKEFRVMVVKIDNFNKIILTKDEFEKQVLITKIYDMIKFVLKDKTKVVSVINFNEVCIIMDEENLEEAIDVAEKIKKEIYKLEKTRVTIGIGKCYKNSKEVSVSYKEADAALRYRFYLGYNTIIPIEYVEPKNNISYVYPMEKEEKLVHTAIVGELNYSRNLINEIYDRLKSIEYISSEVLQKIVMNIMISISRYATENGTKTTGFNKDFFKIDEVFLINNLEEFRNYLLINMRKYCEYVVKNHNEEDERVYKAILEYVSKYYYEAIDLEKIATLVGTSKNYLDKLFKDKEEVSLEDYIKKIRIDESKKMIIETKFDDDFIAIKTGFDNKKDFQMKFKNSVKQSTEEFRKNNTVN